MSDAKSALRSCRTWLRPHLSAIIAGLLAALFLAFWNVAGRQHADGEWHFGWPWEYAQCGADFDDHLKRVMNSSQTFPFEWLRSFLWNKWNVTVEVAWLWICLDVLICGFLALFISGIIEVWRRQRRHVWQIYLREVLGACALLSVVLAWGMQFVQQTRESAKSVSRLKSHTSKAGGIGIDFGLPAVIRENLPPAEFHPLDRVVYASAGIHSHFDDQDYRFLAKQPHLRSVSLNASPGCGARLESLSGLSSIALWNGYLSDDDVRAIARLKGLRTLHVRCILPPQVIPACSRVTSLRRLVICGRLLAFHGEDGQVYDFPTARSRNDIKDGGVVKGDLRPLLRLSSLETLELGGFQVEAGSLVSLAELKGLQSLDVQSCKYDPSELEQLRSLRADMSITGR